MTVLLSNTGIQCLLDFCGTVKKVRIKLKTLKLSKEKKADVILTIIWQHKYSLLELGYKKIQKKKCYKKVREYLGK